MDVQFSLKTCLALKTLLKPTVFIWLTVCYCGSKFFCARIISGPKAAIVCLDCVELVKLWKTADIEFMLA